MTNKPKELKGIYLPHRHRWAWVMSLREPDYDEVEPTIEVRFHGFILVLNDDHAKLLIEQLTEMLSYKQSLNRQE